MPRQRTGCVIKRKDRGGNPRASLEVTATGVQFISARINQAET